MPKIKNDEYQSVCALCEHATPLDGLGGILCEYRGVVPEDGSCRKFSYDILKRTPAPKQKPFFPD